VYTTDEEDEPEDAEPTDVVEVFDRIEEFLVGGGGGAPFAGGGGGGNGPLW